MTVAEKLARQIRRVAQQRELYQASRGDYRADTALALIDALLERACKAIGTGDTGTMEAVGLELEVVQ